MPPFYINNVQRRKNWGPMLMPSESIKYSRVSRGKCYCRQVEKQNGFKLCLECWNTLFTPQTSYKKLQFSWQYVFFNIPIMKRKFFIFTGVKLVFFLIGHAVPPTDCCHLFWAKPKWWKLGVHEVTCDKTEAWNYGLIPQKSLVPDHRLLCWLNSQNGNLHYCTRLIPLKIHVLSLTNHDTMTKRHWEFSNRQENPQTCGLVA